MSIDADTRARIKDAIQRNAPIYPDEARELLDALEEAEREREELRGMWAREQRENWTPTALDRLNTYAREHNLAESHQPEELPALIDRVVFHHMGRAEQQEKRADELKEQRNSYRAELAETKKCLAAQWETDPVYRGMVEDRDAWKARAESLEREMVAQGEELRRAMEKLEKIGSAYVAWKDADSDDPTKGRHLFALLEKEVPQEEPPPASTYKGRPIRTAEDRAAQPCPFPPEPIEWRADPLTDPDTPPPDAEDPLTYCNPHFKGTPPNAGEPSATGETIGDILAAMPRCEECDTTEREMQKSVDYFREKWEAAEARASAAEGAIAKAEDLLMGAIQQGCALDNSESRNADLVDSCALSAYRDAMLWLAERGRLRVAHHYGRRVVGVLLWPSDPAGEANAPPAVSTGPCSGKETLARLNVAEAKLERIRSAWKARWDAAEEAYRSMNPEAGSAEDRAQNAVHALLDELFQEALPPYCRNDWCGTPPAAGAGEGEA